MDLEEVRAWIVPPDYDHSEAEAKHLVFEADEDHDNMLTKEEILEKYDLFVGSQVSRFYSVFEGSCSALFYFRPQISEKLSIATMNFRIRKSIFIIYITAKQHKSDIRE